MAKKVFLFFILIPLVMLFSQGYNNLQVRFAGLVEDVKYVGTKDGSYLFIIYTDKSQLYTISSNRTPYFDLKDSVMEYWIEFKLTGVGKRDRKFFYSIVN
jgi:hypothetical protein